MKKLFLCLLLGIAAAVSGADFVEGLIGQALNKRVAFDYGDNLAPTPAAGTIQFWIKFDTDPKQSPGAMVFSIGNNRGGFIYMALRNDNEATFSAKTFSTRFDFSKVNVGEWTNIAISWGTFKEKSFFNAYINGKPVSHIEKIKIPTEWGPGKIAMRYNQAHWAGPTCPGAIDEMAIYSVALSPEKIKENYDKGLAGTPLEPVPGCTFLAAFDGNMDIRRGGEISADDARKMARKASRQVKLQRYDNEAEYSVSVTPSAIKGVLENICDGNDATQFQWNNVRDVTFICELKSTTDIAFVEIITGKHSDQFLLKEIHVSVATGGDEFGEPQIQQAYGFGKKYPEKTMPNKRYVHKFENLGSASRVKVRLLGDAHCNIMELRIVGK